MKKKITSFGFLFLSVGIFFLYSFYTKESFNYHIAQFIGYLFYWSVTIFVVSLFAFLINDKIYRSWLLFTVLYVFLSLLIAYGVGDGSSAIVSFDGKDITWFLAGLYSFISIIYFAVQYFK